jgi:hypothetical protein
MAACPFFASWWVCGHEVSALHRKFGSSAKVTKKAVKILA